MWLNIKQMIDALDCHLVVEPSDSLLSVEKIVWDSRIVEPRNAFLAIMGENVDGNKFISQAIDNGAAIVLATGDISEEDVAKAKKNGCAVVKIEDYLYAMRQLAAASRNGLDAKVIGITGSNGKTTTKNMVREVCSYKFNTISTLANQNNELGVPATVLNADLSTEVLVVEMGMRGMGQLSSLCEFVKPDIGIITNIGSAHEELLGCKDNIARAKSELLAALPDGSGVAIIPADDPYSKDLEMFSGIDLKDITVLKFGLGDNSDVQAVNIKYSDLGKPSFEIRFPNDARAYVDLPLAGSHNVLNSLAAAACGYVLGMDPVDICAALGKVEGQHMRQEIIKARCGATIINDTYNASPDSMRASLQLLHMMSTQNRRIAVLGDMGELGKNEDKMHAQVGEMAYNAGVDLLFTIGDLSKNIAAGAIQAGMDSSQVVEFCGIEPAIQKLKEMLEPDDVVLVKASRFMELERVVKGLID